MVHQRHERKTGKNRKNFASLIQARAEKMLITTCRCQKKQFYQNSNLHVILIAFGPLKKKQYEILKERIAKTSFTKNQNYLL